jgi:ferric-dicitrate binding protein FerR (iron transport regulator)
MWATLTPGKAGVVGALDGVVNVQRVGLPGSVPLKVWDDVFLQDRIASGDGARIEVALGDKMHLAMRERSIITISETPGRATVDLDAGDVTIAMRGDRSLLDVIEVRTPNAIATARGGTRMRVVVVSQENSPGFVAHVDVLDGSVTVAIHADFNNPLYRGAPADVEVNANQGITITGETPGPIRPLRN